MLRWKLASSGALGSNGFDAITTLSKRAYGYRNLHNLRTALLFHLGGLNLPVASLSAAR